MAIFDFNSLGASGLGGYGGQLSNQQAEEERRRRELEQQKHYQMLQQMMQPLQWIYGDAPDAKESIKKLAKGIKALRKVEAAKLSKPMPDHIATLTGWRGWRVEHEQLKALGKDEVWEPKKAPEARCKQSSLSYAEIGNGKHAAPSRECKCGYWSFKSMDLLQQALDSYASSVVVVGSVEIWGRVIETENGYRSQYAYPKELWLLKPDLDYLSWTYGVPVRKLATPPEKES